MDFLQWQPSLSICHIEQIVSKNPVNPSSVYALIVDRLHRFVVHPSALPEWLSKVEAEISSE